MFPLSYASICWHTNFWHSAQECNLTLKFVIGSMRSFNALDSFGLRVEFLLTASYILDDTLFITNTKKAELKIAVQYLSWNKDIFF